MKVNDSIMVLDNHSIEWGGATCDETDFSIRNRYNTDTGKLNQEGSSELPWHDFLQEASIEINFLMLNFPKS